MYKLNKTFVNFLLSLKISVSKNSTAINLK